MPLVSLQTEEKTVCLCQSRWSLQATKAAAKHHGCTVNDLVTTVMAEVWLLCFSSRRPALLNPLIHTYIHTCIHTYTRLYIRTHARYV